ncbi:hypothetical protein [Actinacidiphila acididurans]|uniref:Uncharacterized protein n=1 Tax=Actinacidiphila acididurans TaxID=2784346 RepID=A0ABS2TSI0_9ACTN|nr:hypothetical protein [Actinacidiphila acididurans]MBM9506037.1 hypothetical protein [Actinacidiphila acididurans]
MFVTENGTGTGVLLGLGGVLLVLALFEDRLESFEFGGAKLRLRAAAADTYALAEEAERQGDSSTARRLREEARALLGVAEPAAAEYRALRDSMAPGPERTRALEEHVARTRRRAKEERFEPAEVLRWLREGNEEQRVTALVLMQALRELRDFEAVLDAIGHSYSAFEQYHAMRLAVDMVDDLDARQLRRLAETVTSQRGYRFFRGGDRWTLSGNILEKISARSSDTPAGDDLAR